MTGKCLVKVVLPRKLSLSNLRTQSIPIYEVLDMMMIKADLKGIQLFFDKEKTESYQLSPEDESQLVVKDKLPIYVTGDM